MEFQVEIMCPNDFEYVVVQERLGWESEHCILRAV